MQEDNKTKPSNWKYGLIGFVVFFAVSYSVRRAEEKAKWESKLNKMAAVMQAHSFEKDTRFYLPEVRQKWVAHTREACAETDETKQAMKDANDGMLRPENATDYEAIEKVCQDTFGFLSIAQEADDTYQWVPGADGGYVLADGPLKERFRAAIEKTEADAKTLATVEKAAQATYEQQQSDGRK
jgi:hypothetical protein